MKVGRKTKYKVEYGELIKRLLAFGMSCEEIAEKFHISSKTIDYWKKKHPDFNEKYNSGMLYYKIRIHFENSNILDIIETLAASGWTIEEISNKIGYEQKIFHDKLNSSMRMRAAFETGSRMYKKLLDVVDYYDFSLINEDIMKELQKCKHTGCITKFDTSYCERAKILMGAGASQRVIAKDIGVLPATISKWRSQYPEFDAAIKEGKQLFEDMQRLRLVEKALFKRATGQEVIEDILEPAPDDPKKLILKKRTKKFSPGSFDAQSFFLTNRRPDRWKVKPEVIETRSSGEVIHTVAPEVAELLGRIKGTGDESARQEDDDA